MKFTVASVAALLVAGAYAAPAAELKPRGPQPGCHDLAPYRMGYPGDFWYPICCAYSIADPVCCNTDPKNPIDFAGKPYPPCPGAV